MSNINTATQQGIQPDTCPINLKSKDCPGKTIPNKLQKPLRQHPSYRDPPVSPKCPKPNPKEPVGKPLSAALKAKIREGPVGKSLGRLAVEHNLVPYPYEDALLGIPQDDRHSRWSYMMIANEAIDHARLHLEKGERPKYVHPADAHTQSAPAALCVPTTSEICEVEHFEAKNINLSAPVELEARESRQHHLNAVELPATIRRPSALRPGKRHPLCEKFEQSTDTNGKVQDRHELHFNRPKPRKPTNLSIPLPSVLQIQYPKSRRLHKLDSDAGNTHVSRHPTALRAGARRCNTEGPGVEQGSQSDSRFSLIDNREHIDLINFTAPAAISTETEDVRNIKMLIARMPSVRENDVASPQTEAKRRSRQHRGTVIVTCDTDKANGVTDDSLAKGIAALKELGQTQNTQDSGYASDAPINNSNPASPNPGYGSESPVVATAVAAVSGRAKLAEVVNSSHPPAIELEAHAHPHPLRSNPTNSHPHPLRSNPTVPSVPRSLKSVRRVTRDPANQGVAFGVQQFPDFDPAAVHRGSDEYRLMRAVRRREAKKVSDAIDVM